MLADEFVGRARVRMKGRAMRESKVESVLKCIVEVVLLSFRKLMGCSFEEESELIIGNDGVFCNEVDIFS